MNQGSKKFAMDIESIKNFLPHRYPFLLVDRVLEMRDDYISGIKIVTTNEPFFEGHFPEKPVMPGVLIIEAMAQLGAVFTLSKPENKGKIAYLVAIDNARFRRMVMPGDQLHMEITIIRMKSKVGIVKAIASVDGEAACEAELMYTIGE